MTGTKSRLFGPTGQLSTDAASPAVSVCPASLQHTHTDVGLHSSAVHSRVRARTCTDVSNDGDPFGAHVLAIGANLSH